MGRAAIQNYNVSPRLAIEKYISIMTLVLTNAMITVSMVIAPPSSGIMQLSDKYKTASLLVGAIALLIAIRKRWFVPLFVFSILQFATFLLFASYLNGVRH